MQREDWFWLAVRLMGLLLILRAIMAATILVTAIFSLPKDNLVGSAVQVVLFGAAGIYLIRDGGRVLLRWASRDREDKSDTSA